MPISLLSETLCFGGKQQRYSHHSDLLNCKMTFSIYLPPQAFVDNKLDSKTSLPSLIWLSGLTCNDENFVQKAGAQRVAAELGMVVITPDTSPRGEDIPDDPDAAYDFGLGAGFYVDATQQPWSENYQMYSYITKELPQLFEQHFPVSSANTSISGHSMGGHGALSIALKNPSAYKSVSAFAPICSALNCPWGEKALSIYLGEDTKAWDQYDVATLIRDSDTTLPVLVDQGDADNFLLEQLKPELLLKAAVKVGHPIDYKLRAGYDHSYFYIATFIEEHLRFHHSHLTIAK